MKISEQVWLMHEEDGGLGNSAATFILQMLKVNLYKEFIQTYLFEFLVYDD